MDLLSKIPILNEPNPRLVLRLVREAESVSRADLARATGLHPSTITRLVAALLEAGLLQESGEGQNDLGRKPIVLSVVEDAIHVVGLAEAGFVSGVLVNLGARTRKDRSALPPAEQDSVLRPSRGGGGSATALGLTWRYWRSHAWNGGQRQRHQHLRPTSFWGM